MIKNSSLKEAHTKQLYQRKASSPGIVLSSLSSLLPLSQDSRLSFIISTVGSSCMKQIFITWFDETTDTIIQYISTWFISCLMKINQRSLGYSCSYPRLWLSLSLGSYSTTISSLRWWYRLGVLSFLTKYVRLSISSGTSPYSHWLLSTVKCHGKMESGSLHFLCMDSVVGATSQMHSRMKEKIQSQAYSTLTINFSW